MPRCPTSCILLVDDELNLLRTLRVILQRAGYLVLTASTARETYLILKQYHVDLLVLDIHLEDTSGIDILGRVRVELPGLSVVMLTAYPDPESRMAAITQGARDYLIKPIDPKAFLYLVQAILPDPTN